MVGVGRWNGSCAASPAASVDRRCRSRYEPSAPASRRAAAHIQRLADYQITIGQLNDATGVCPDESHLSDFSCFCESCYGLIRDLVVSAFEVQKKRVQVLYNICLAQYFSAALDQKCRPTTIADNTYFRLITHAYNSTGVDPTPVPKHIDRRVKNGKRPSTKQAHPFHGGSRCCRKH